MSTPSSNVTGEDRIENPSVVVRALQKDYRVHRDRKGAKKLLPSFEIVSAVKDVSFVVNSGESVGLLGHNGSGKSTLLRLIAGSEDASRGEILTSDRPTLLGVNAALQPHLSGIRNIKLGLLASGMPEEKLEEAIQDVAVFTELGEALYRPMATYSSGMGARLGFAIATTRRPEILLIDEALSTGDATFASKAEVRMNEMLSNSGTVFLVSHAPTVIQQMCDRALWMHEGELIANGDVEEISNGYSSWAHRQALGELEWAGRIIEEFKEQFPVPEIQLI